LNKNILTRTM